MPAPFGRRVRRLFSIFTLLIAASWLIGGVSTEMSDDASGEFSSGVHSGELRVRLKAVKVQVSAMDGGRAAAPVPMGTSPRTDVVAVRLCSVITRGALLAQRPQSAAVVPPAPSLTGQIVLVI